MHKMLPFIIVASMGLSSCEALQQVASQTGQFPGTGQGGLSTFEIASGLKEALNVGTERTSNKLGAVDGYFANAAIKILLPEEAQKVERTLRSVGLGKLVDNAVLSVNRAAEQAATKAGPVFKQAITTMTINDAIGILRGGQTSATDYFRNRTTATLAAQFKPVIDQALANTNATRYWSDLFTAYNKVARTPVNPDLSSYVAEKAINGIFYQVAREEMAIRQDPIARSTDLLKKVFGSREAQGATSPVQRY